MPAWFTELFDTDRYMPHGGCLLWTPGLVAMHVISDILIGLSYVAISLSLVWLVRRARKDIPFQWMFLAFGVFIVACGGTHFMEALTVYKSYYWLSGVVKVVTAAASLVTAFALPPLIPTALRLLRDARVSEERRLKLEDAHAELTTVYEQLKEFDALKTRFFANVSHELRTPLSLVLGPVERILAEDASEPNLTARQRRDMGVVGQNARTLLTNVNDLLDVSRLEAGEMQPDYSAFNLARLVRVMAAHFDALAYERRIAYSVETPELLLAELDVPKTQRVLLNLLSNAFKFTPREGRIVCRLSERREEAEFGHVREWAEVSVSDSGPGVSPEMRQAVFERFRQTTDSAERSTFGTGLGLAIVKEFVSLQGGTVRLDGAEEGGARFTVLLPLAAPESATANPDPMFTSELTDEMTLGAVGALLDGERDALVEGDGSSEGAPSVLIVEDNHEMRRFLADSLRPEYRVAEAAEGQDALRQALASPPDLLLSDVVMPGMDGERLLREVRSHRALDNTPMVMLTARADDETRLRLLQEGAQDYLSKPFSVEELRARIRNLVTLARARGVLQRELATQSGDLEALTREIAARNRELQRAFDSMRVAREQAEQASRVKGDFLRMVSHELRTPLNVLQLQLTLTERQAGDMTDRQRETLGRMRRANQRLHILIETLLDYARVESGRLTVRITSFDLRALTEEIVEDARPTAEAKGLALELIAPDDPLPMETDPHLLGLALSNLVANALKFTGEGGVRVELEGGAEERRITVRDTGPGISEADLSRIFEPFEQLEAVSHKHTPGVGLGLAIVKNLVTALGGRIEVQSKPGQGSAFTFTMPLVAHEAPRQPETSPAPSPAPSRDRAGGTP